MDTLKRDPDGFVHVRAAGRCFAVTGGKLSHLRIALLLKPIDCLNRLVARDHPGNRRLFHVDGSGFEDLLRRGARDAGLATTLTDMEKSQDRRARSNNSAHDGDCFTDTQAGFYRGIPDTCHCAGRAAHVPVSLLC